MIFNRYKGKLHKVRVFNDKDYMFETEPSLVEPDEEPEPFDITDDYNI